MDSIDITSPEFSLGGFSELNNVNSDTISLGNVSSDYATYIYIGVVIFISIISYFIYKFFINRVKRVTFQDTLEEECVGEMCQR